MGAVNTGYPIFVLGPVGVKSTNYRAAPSLSALPPISRPRQDGFDATLSAITRLMHRSKTCAIARYSITSSARSKNNSEIVSPSAFAVLRLMTSSNFVGCRIGKAAGLAPLRIRPT
jgi:hypothetical protein